VVKDKVNFKLAKVQVLLYFSSLQSAVNPNHQTTAVAATKSHIDCGCSTAKKSGRKKKKKNWKHKKKIETILEEKRKRG
jgi:translation initiation factor 2 alpha subunit (eIF-2alpha)